MTATRPLSPAQREAMRVLSDHPYSARALGIDVRVLRALARRGYAGAIEPEAYRWKTTETKFYRTTPRPR
jgi:hypothetical protein